MPLNIKCRNIRLFFLISLFSVSFNSRPVIAGMINIDCEPSGISNILAEKMYHKTFWADALIDVEREVKAARDELRISIVTSQNDKIRSRLQDNELRALGIEPLNDPEYNRIVSENEKDFQNILRQQLSETVRWAEKCRKIISTKK
jgi:hypothetical protein